jgi:hypothetical protein
MLWRQGANHRQLPQFKLERRNNGLITSTKITKMLVQDAQVEACLYLGHASR